MHIRLSKVRRDGVREGSKPRALGQGHCMKGQYDPLGTELCGEGKIKRTIKPNTKYFKNGLWQVTSLILKASYNNVSGKIFFYNIVYASQVRKWGQNDPASKLISSKGALARNTEIILNQMPLEYIILVEKKSTHETKKRRRLLLCWEKGVRI